MLKEDKTLWVCSEDNASNPVKILDNVESIETAYNNSFAVMSDGTLWGWGEN
jgi:hypothetical protein